LPFVGEGVKTVTEGRSPPDPLAAVGIAGAHRLWRSRAWRRSPT
jgi:hypothetical protein